MTTIEQAINQRKPFRNELHKAAVNLMYTHNWLVRHIQEHLAPFGITMKQYNVLRILRGENEPISTSTIRERMLDSMSDASRLVDRLHQKGLIQRDTCSEDRRMVNVSITQQGLTLLAKIDTMDSYLDDLLGALNTSEATQMNDLLDKIRSKTVEIP